MSARDLSRSESESRDTELNNKNIIFLLFLYVNGMQFHTCGRGLLALLILTQCCAQREKDLEKGPSGLKWFDLYWASVSYKFE